MEHKLQHFLSTPVWTVAPPYENISDPFSHEVAIPHFTKWGFSYEILETFILVLVTDLKRVKEHNKLVALSKEFLKIKLELIWPKTNKLFFVGQWVWMMLSNNYEPIKSVNPSIICLLVFSYAFSSIVSGKRCWTGLQCLCPNQCHCKHWMPDYVVGWRV